MLFWAFFFHFSTFSFLPIPVSNGSCLVFLCVVWNYVKRLNVLAEMKSCLFVVAGLTCHQTDLGQKKKLSYAVFSVDHFLVCLAFCVFFCLLSLFPKSWKNEKSMSDSCKKKVKSGRKTKSHVQFAQVRSRSTQSSCAMLLAVLLLLAVFQQGELTSSFRVLAITS